MDASESVLYTEVSLSHDLIVLLYRLANVILMNYSYLYTSHEANGDGEVTFDLTPLTDNGHFVYE